MSLRNIYPFNDALNGEETIDFPVPIRDIQITNMSASTTLEWKFREAEEYSVLEPTEIITMEGTSQKQVLLKAVSGAYRVLAWG